MNSQPARPGDGVLHLLGSPDQLPERLEAELVGPGLLALVRDLEAVTGSDNDAIALPTNLRDRIVTSGLCALDDSELQTVLVRPRYLLQLQSEVLLHGSPYWDEVMRRADARTELGDIIPTPAGRTRLPRWLTHLLSAATAAAIVLVVTNRQVRHVDNDLRLARAENARLRAELRAIPPVVPADLPEESSELVTTDPPDLPEGDPADLPATPKPRSSDV
jgi:hypothetical protein